MRIIRSIIRQRVQAAAVLAALLVTTAARVVCAQGSGQAALPAVAVSVSKPTRQDIHRYVTLPATIKANQQATLYAKVGGYLAKLTVDKGDRVAAGQVLGEIEVPELIAERVRQGAELEVAQRDYQRLALAQKQAADLVTARSVDEAHGRLDMARASLQRTDTLLGFARLTAPFAGVVVARHVDPGAFIPAATSVGAGSAAIVTIADMQTVRVHVPVPAAEALRVAVGQPVRVSFEGWSGPPFAATVSRHGYAVEGSSQTLTVEADIANPEERLRPGMVVTAKVGVERHDQVLTIPTSALGTEKGGAFVFVAVDGVARKKPLRVGFNDGARVEVVDGLTVDTTVIVTGKDKVSDGISLQVVETR